MADENKVPSNIEFVQQDINNVPDPNLFSDMPSELDYDIMFDEFQTTVNSIVYPNNYDPSKDYKTGNAGPNYNPYNENVKFSGNQIDLLKEYSNNINDLKKDTKPLTPILTSKKLTDFERYYNHNKFQQLGFNPYRDNETLYNENSTFWDDFSRMGSQFGKLLTTGFVSSYRSLGDLFDDDDYFTGKDLDSAREFAEAMRIGNSTRGGIGGFLNNLTLQSAYTFGIIANIAVEEAALTFITGGGSLFTAPIRGAAKTGSILKNLTRIEQAKKGLSLNVINKLEDVDEAKSFFQAVKSGDSKLMNFILPETMQARKALNSSDNVINHMSDIGKQAKTFGGFYRDLRSLNYALSESKMEGGMVYDQVVANGIAERMKQSETGLLSDKDLQLVRDNANKASMATTMLNAPFIYFSNQFLLGTAFGGFNKSLAKIIGDNTDALARRIITKPIRDAEGKIIDTAIRKTSGGVRGTLDKLFDEGIRKMSGVAALRYFSNNFGEGIQEVYQEAVAKGTEYYYESIIKDPVSQQKGLFMASMGEAITSQLSGEGFHTFMSGFLMGGLVSVPQQIMFRGVPNMLKYISNKEEYNKQNEIFEKQLDKYVKNYNETLKLFQENPSEFLNTTTINAALQKMVSEDNAEAVNIDSVFDFLNGKDAAKFIHIHSLLKNNSVNIFRKQLNDYLKLSDEDIATAFPMLRSEVKSGKAKERLTSFINQIDKIEEDYIKHKNKFQNPFDETKFDKLTQLDKYLNELVKKQAYDHVTFLAMFSSNQIRRTAKRMQSMYAELESVPLFEGMAANDLTVLLSEKRLDEELKLLRTEVELLEESKDKSGLKDKKQKLTDLQKIFEISQMKSKKGVYDRRRQKTLTKAIITYANNLAKTKNTSIDTLEIDSVIQKIFDYAALEKDNYRTRQTVEMLNDPNKFNELYDRTYAALTTVSTKQQYRQQLATVFHIAQFRKYLIEILEQRNIALDVEELVKFAEGGYSDVSLITKVYIEDKESTDADVLEGIREELQILVEVYQNAQQKEKEDEDIEDDLIVSDRVKEILESAGVEMPGRFNATQENLLKDYTDSVIEFLKLLQVDINENLSLIEDFATLIAIVATKENISFYNLDEVIYNFLNGTVSEESKNIIENYLEHKDVVDIKEDIESYFIGTGEKIQAEKEEQSQEEESQEEEEEDQEEETEAQEEEQLIEDEEVFEEYIDADTNIPITVKKKNDKYHLYYKLNGQEKSIALNYNLLAYFQLLGKKISFDTLEEANNVVNNLKANPEAPIYTNNNEVLGKNQTVYTIKDFKEHKIESGIVEYLKDGIIRVDGKDYTSESFYENYITEKPPKSKNNTISSVDNDVRLIPANDSSGVSIDSKSFQVALMSINLQDDENVTINISENTTSPKNTKFQPDKNEDPNNNINYKKAPYYISISVSDGLLSTINSKLEALGYPKINQNNIAILNTGNIQYLDAKGNPIKDFTQITKEQAKLYYSLLNDDNKSIEFTDALYDQLINNFASQQVLNLKVESLLEEGKTQLSLKEFQEQTGITFREVFSYDYSKSETSNLNDLAFNEFDGQITIFQNIYDPSINGITTIIVRGSSTSQEAFNFAKNNNNIQGYIAVVKLPNGRLVYVPLKASVLSEQQMSEKVDEIKKQLEEINKDSNNAKKIKEFNDNPKFFISLNKYEYVDMYYLKESDKLSISYIDKSTEESKRISVTLTSEEYKDLTPETLQQKFDELNAKIEKYYKQKKQSETPVKIEIGNTVRNYFPKNTGLETLTKNTETNLSNKIFKSFNLVYQASTEDVTQQKQKIKNKTEEKDTETKVQSKEAIADIITAQLELGAELETILNTLHEQGYVIKNNNSTLVDLQKGRDAVVFYIDGVIVPMYRSSEGTSSKIKGNWYPFFYATDNWVVKALSKNYKDGYGNPIIKQIQDALNKNYKYEKAKSTVKVNQDQLFNDIFGELINLGSNYNAGVYDAYNYYHAALILKNWHEKLGGVNIVGYKEYISGVLKSNIFKEYSKLNEGFEEKSRAIFSEVEKILDSIIAEKETKTDLNEGIGNIDSYIDYLNTLTLNELKKLVKSETRKAILAKRNKDEEAQKQANENRKLINKVLATKGRNIINRKADLIISDNHDEMSIEDIETFTEWMKENLPDYISIDDIETLTDNMLKGGVRVGAFILELKKLSNKLSIQGKILTSKDSPGKYHEAFHAVFRMLLSDKQIDKLLSIAKKEVKAKLRSENKNYIEELSNFKNLSEEYESLSAKELEDLYLEEYIANEFDKFKSNPRSTKTNPAIKNFFSKLIDIIKSLFKGFVTLNNKDYANLNDLFIDIDTGKYKSATLMDNRFTSVLEQGDSTIANALIPYYVDPENEYDNQYLDSSTGDALVANIYARVVNLEFKAKSQVSISELVDESIALFKDLYQRNFEKNEDEFGLLEVTEALEDFSDVIKEQVLERLRYANITQENIDEFIENDVQNLNETGLNTNNYNMKAELLGMEKSLPTFIRKYFASTTLVSVDKFGNEFLVDPIKDEDGNIIQEGERIVTSINPADAYSGFLRATQNIYNPVEMFKSLIAFSENGNPETKAVVDRMLLDTGLTREDVENLINTDDFTFMDVFGDKDTVLLNKILKAFENTKFSYRFQVYESAKGIVTSYDSMQNNAVKAQLAQWTNEHIDKLRLFKNSAQGKLSTKTKIERALNLYQGIYKNNQDLKNASIEISQILFDTMGITLHPMYIQYSIVSDTIEVNGQNVLNINTKHQQFIYNINKDTTPFNLDDLQQLQKNFLAENYLLQRTGSLNNIMKKLANNNVRFDESIGTTTFLNPENEKVYAHQLPTFNARMAYMLEKDFEGTMAILLERDDILKYNYLFNSPEFQNFVEDGYFNYERIAGLIIDSSTEDKFIRSGKSYGKFNIEDFLLSMLGSYTSLINKRNGKQYDSKGNEVETAMAPIFTRVAETSRTGPSFMMPIIKAVDSNGNISQEVVEIFYNYLKGEFERIQKESDFSNQTPLLNKYNARDVNGELVRDDSKETTAFTLFKTKGILNNQVQSVYQIDESFKMPKLYEKVLNNETGTVKITNRTKLAKALQEGEVNKVTITKGKNKQEAFIEILSVKDGELTLKYSNSFNPIQDNDITNELEKLANDPQNFGKSFEDILKSSPMFEFDSNGIPTFIREKLNADFNRFLYILKGKNIDISNEDSAFYKILSGDVYSLDLSWMENLDYQEEQFDAIEAKMLQNYRASLENYNLKEATDIKGIKDNLKQIYFNHFINASSLNQLFLGDHAKMFKSFQQEVKRGKSPEAHGTSAKTPFASQRLGVGPVESFDLIPGTEPKNTSAISGNEMDVADGQLYMTVKTFKHILWGLGELFTEEHAKLLDKIDRGEKLTSEEIFGVFNKYGKLEKEGMVQRGEMMNLKKYIYADAQNLVKMSAHVIRRADVSEKNYKGEWVAKDNMVVLHNMLNKMEQHQEATGNLTMMAPLSAIKKIQENINDLNKIQSTDSLDVDSDGNPIPLGAMKLDAEFFMLQQKNPSNKQEVTDPTQITWLLLNEQDDNQEVTINGENVPILDIKKNFEAFKSYILSLNHVGKRNLTFQETLNDFNVNKKLIGDKINLSSFARYAAESKKASQSSSEKLEFFELDANGDLKYDLNSPLTNKDFEDLLLSYFSKQVFKQKIPGSQLTITADHGRRIYRRVLSVKKVTLNGVTYTIPDKQETLRSDEVQKFAEIKNNVEFHIDKDSNGNISNVGSDSNLDGLEQAIERSGGKGVIIIDRLRYDMEEYTYEDKYDLSTWEKTGQRYSESIMAPITKQVYEYLNISNKDTRIKFTHEKLLTLYEEWVSTEQIQTKKGKFVSRKSRKDFNPELAKISFAKQMGVFYDKKKKEFLSNTEFSIPEVLAKLFALRIPTQDKHSALAIKVVDFMDATNGSTISVAREIIEVSGADFDIDKLFAHMKELFFNKKTRTFVAYGETKGEEFSDYIRYINNKVYKPGNIYFEAYEKVSLNKRLPYGVELTDKEIETYKKLGFNERAYISLKTLGLPLSLDKFEEFEKQYGYYPIEGMMQNKVLDYKFALVGNKSVTETTKLYKDKDGNLSSTKKKGYEETNLELPAVSYEPADMEVLEKIKNEFKALFPQWSQTILKDLFDNDTITGALLAYQNNQIGSRLIGASVLPNTYLPKLGTLGISIRENFAIKFNGKSYNKYGAILEDNGDSTYGYRTQYLMSALISAMVDNATEQYAGKFGININSLGVISNFVMLGVPLKTSLMMILNPTISNLYNQTNTGSQFKREAYDIITKLNSKLSDNDKSTNLTNDILQNNINNNFDINKILEKENKDITQDELEFMKQLYTVLTNYMKGVELSDYNFSLGVLFSMQKGIKSTEDLFKIDEAIKNLSLEKKLSPGQLEKHPFDANRVFVDKNPLNAITRTLYNAYKNLKFEMLPKLVTTQTEAFIDLFNAVTDKNLGFVNKKGKNKIKYDLASYLILKEYYNNMMSQENKEFLDSLSNNIVYPIDNNSNKNEGTIVNKIFAALENKEGLQIEDNFFINQFITIKSAYLEGNYTNLDIISNNLMSKIPDHRKFDIQSDFIKLFKDAKTRSLAVDIFHYLLVKDGLQFRQDSIVQVISPVIMQDYLSSSASVFEKFSKYQGVNLSELITDFISNYYKSANINQDGDIRIKSIKNVQEKPRTKEEQAFLIESDENIIFEDKALGELVINPYKLPFPQNRMNDTLTPNGLAVINRKNRKQEVDKKSQILSNSNILTFFSKKTKEDKLDQYVFPTFLSYKGKLYEISKVVSKQKEDQIFTKDKPYYVGLSARYKVADIKGSSAQWGAGFVLGNVPDQTKLAENVKKNKDIQFEKYLRAQEQDDLLVLDNVESNLENDDVLYAKKKIDEELEKQDKDITDINKLLGTNFKNTTELAQYLTNTIDQTDTKSVEEFLNCKGLTINLDF